MKKFLLLMSLAPFTLSAIAQTTFAPLFTPDLDSTWNTKVSFFDADQDGDQDLFYNGGNADTVVSELLMNNGSGQFTANSQQFLSVVAGRVLSGDFDADGDNDLFISGVDGSNRVKSVVYDNDGAGVFTPDTNSAIFPFFVGDAEVLDSDGDSDLDIILTGFNTFTSTAETILHLNDGAGNFTPASVNFDGLGFTFADITVGDVDADGDQDIFACGEAYAASSYVGMTSRLYLNDGGNSFTSSVQNFMGLYGAAQFTDYDNDSDLDLIMVGADFSATYSFIYDNDGSGQFSVSALNPIPSLGSPAMKLFDADLDGDQDLFVTGADDVAQMNVFAYFDNQNGTFVLMNGQPFPGIWGGTIEAGDIDGDTDMDILLAGIQSLAADSVIIPFASIYVNALNPLGVQHPAIEDFHGVYPNPIAQNQLKYSVAGLQLKKAYDLEVKDCLGRTILRQENVQHDAVEASIGLDGVQPGAYLLVLRSGTRQYCSKFIVVGN
jgi:Secretion system C-terminal sorting domain/FG-GAP-like repeat